MITSSSRVPTSLLQPQLLKDVHDTWFKGVGTNKAINGFPKEAIERWYMQSNQFDSECSQKFKDALVDLSESNVTAEDLDSTITSPEDRHSLILLLDQMGRNIFRGNSAKVAHSKLDPLAEALVLKWLKEPVLIQYHPAWKLVPHVRSWFYMPLMHSESLESHQLVCELYETFRAELVKAGLDESLVDTSFGFEKKHRAVIEKFGRYPSRNACMGRESTEEEKELLKTGPGW